jgi:spermidine synthase
MELKNLPDCKAHKAVEINLFPLQLALLYFIFFISGASSLISEITWNRMLVLIVGNTVSAASMIIVSFMGGLAIGSYWGGCIFRRPSFLPYAILEVCIGLYVILSPIFFYPLSSLFTNMAPSFADSSILSVVRFAITLFSLFIPAFLMGATFPAIIAGAASGSLHKRASRTGYLYSINTLGASLGCLLAGYILLPKFGAQLTLLWAFSLNIAAAIGGLLLNILSKNMKPQHSTDGAQHSTEAPSFLLLINIATFIVGFIALSYEVLLTRLVILYFGNQVIVFTLVLFAFLLGTGISAITGTWMQGLISRPAHLFTILIMMAGVSLMAPPFLFISLSSSQNQWLSQNQGSIVVFIMLIPTFLIGGLLPIAIRVFQAKGRSDITINAGRLYALNTLGGVLGAGITNFLLVPFFGTQMLLSIFSAIFLIIGLSLLWYLKTSLFKWSAAAICTLFISIFTFNLPHNFEKLYTNKLSQYSGNDINPQLMLHHEGSVATVTVIDFPYLGFRDMFLNGVEEASTRFGHVQLFKLLGLLPVLAHDNSPLTKGNNPLNSPFVKGDRGLSQKDVLVIAFGAGITAGASLDSGLVSSLDVVDLNPDIEKINDLFKEVNGDVYHNPKFNFIAEDGRNYLLMSPKRYPVIISDATHPRAYDSWILYTEEFYQDVKRHLTPDGVFAQWVPLSDFSLEMYKILLNTFTKVFPNAALWNIYGTDQAFLLSTPEAFSLDIKRLQRQLDSMPSSLQLKKYQLDRAVDIAGFFTMDTDTIKRFIGEENRLNTDDLSFNQKYSLKEVSPLWRQSFDQYQTSVLPYLKNGDKGDTLLISEKQAMARAMQRYFFFQDSFALDDALSIMPEDGNAVYYRNLESRKIRMVSEKMKSKHSTHSSSDNLIMGKIQAIKGNLKEAESIFLKLLENEPYNSSIREGLLEIYAKQREYKKAIDLLLDMKPVESIPESYQYYVNLAGVYFSIKDFEKAEEYLLRSLNIYPNNTLARNYLVRVYLQKKNLKEAVLELNRILEINPYNESAVTQLIGIYKEIGKDEDANPLQEILKRIQELQVSKFTTESRRHRENQ